jgi:hypothetical protein
MKSLTPNMVVEIMKDYDYELSREQAIEIMELLEDFKVNDRYTMNDLEICTDFIVLGKQSPFVDYF